MYKIHLRRIFGTRKSSRAIKYVASYLKGNLNILWRRFPLGLSFILKIVGNSRMFLTTVKHLFICNKKTVYDSQTPLTVF